MRHLLIILACLPVSGCLGMPENVQPISDFELNRYLGRWYEIARLDHSFERGLEKVTAEYTGKGYFVNGSDKGYLKVSFFGPFYGSYVVFDLDRENYQYAFISGPDLTYLWLLSRTPEISAEIMSRFIEKADYLGFDTSDLILVNQKSSILN